MSNPENVTVPEIFQEDIGRAVCILKEGGCSEIFDALFSIMQGYSYDGTRFAKIFLCKNRLKVFTA